MATLVLVDVDNVREALAGLLRVAPPVPAAEPDVVVVFALNTSTVRRSFRDVTDLSARVPSLLVAPPSAIGVEIALTLTMPAAVDSALLELMSKAPSAAHARTFDRVVAVTRDDGLLGEVGKRLRQRGFERDAGHPGVTLRACAWEHGDLRRRAPDVPQDAEPDPPGALWSTRITNTAHAAWASTLAPPLPDRLIDLANHADGLPGELSRIGITSATVRGVARLTDRTTAIGHADGVELHLDHRRPAPPAGAAARPDPSPIGAGAVWLPLHAATVRTRLPLDVLRAGWSDHHVKWRSGAPCGPCSATVEDRSVLADVPGGERIGPAVLVGVAKRFDPLRIEFSTGAYFPRAWWARDRTATGTLRVEPMRFVGQPFDVQARMVVLPLGPEHAVCLVTALERWPFEVALGSPVPGGSIVRAHAGGRPVALVTLDRERRGRFPCVPVQAVARDAPVLGSLDPDLLVAPVVVPYDEVSEHLSGGRLQVQEDA